MDEESVGMFGMLLIVTALVMSQSLHRPQPAPSLPQITWQDVVSVFGCGEGSDGCYVASNQ